MVRSKPLTSGALTRPGTRSNTPSDPSNQNISIWNNGGTAVISFANGDRPPARTITVQPPCCRVLTEDRRLGFAGVRVPIVLPAAIQITPMWHVDEWSRRERRACQRPLVSLSPRDRIDKLWPERDTAVDSLLLFGKDARPQLCDTIVCWFVCQPVFEPYEHEPYNNRTIVIFAASVPPTSRTERQTERHRNNSGGLVA